MVLAADEGPRRVTPQYWLARARTPLRWFGILALSSHSMRVSSELCGKDAKFSEWHPSVRLAFLEPEKI
jgi:hypothetical protein